MNNYVICIAITLLVASFAHSDEMLIIDVESVKKMLASTTNKSIKREGEGVSKPSSKPAVAATPKESDIVLDVAEMRKQLKNAFDEKRRSDEEK